MRELAECRPPGLARADERPDGHGRLRRRRHTQRHLHVHVLQQDAGALADGRRQAIRQGRRRHRDRRGCGHGRAETSGGCRTRRRPHLCGDSRYRHLERRAIAEYLRTPRGRADRGPPRRLRGERHRPGHRAVGGGPRDRHDGRRRRRVRRAQDRLFCGAVRPDLVRARIDQVADRAHEGRRRCRRTDQGGARPAPQGAAGDDQGRRAQSHPRHRRQPLLSQHRDPAVALRERPAPSIERQRVRLRRE